jgi:hypothetical protein
MSFLLYKSSIICMGVPYLCHEGHQSRIGVVSLLHFMRSSSRASQVYVKLPQHLTQSILIYGRDGDGEGSNFFSFVRQIWCRV